MCYEYNEYYVCATCERKMECKQCEDVYCQVAKDANVKAINCPNRREPIEILIEKGDCGRCMSEKVEAAQAAAAAAAKK